MSFSCLAETLKLNRILMISLQTPLSFLALEVPVTCTYLPGNHQFSQGHWSSIFRGNPLESGQSLLLVPRQHIIPGTFRQPLREQSTHREMSQPAKKSGIFLEGISGTPDAHITKDNRAELEEFHPSIRLGLSSRTVGNFYRFFYIIPSL